MSPIMRYSTCDKNSVPNETGLMGHPVILMLNEWQDKNWASGMCCNCVQHISTPALMEKTYCAICCTCGWRGGKDLSECYSCLTKALGPVSRSKHSYQVNPNIPSVYRDQCPHNVDLTVLEYWNHGTTRMMLRWIHMTEMAVGNMKHDTKYEPLLNKSGWIKLSHASLVCIEESHKSCICLDSSRERET